MHCINNYSKEFTSGSERVIGRRARGFQTEEIGFKCQTFFISPLSSRRKQVSGFFLLKFCVALKTPGSTQLNFSQTLS